MSRHCYLCDRPIPVCGYRRWVDTGNSGYGRIYISRRGISGGSATGGRRTGLRTVCADCAAGIDAQSARKDHFTQIAIECATILFLGFCLVSYLESHGFIPTEYPFTLTAMSHAGPPYVPPAPHVEASTRGATRD